MFCKNCGHEINDNAVICPNCGVATDKYYNTTASTAPVQKNNMALIGFILSFFIAIAGLIVSIIGYQNVKKPEYNGDGKGFATAGIIISAVSLAGSLIYVVIVCMIWMNILFMW